MTTMKMNFLLLACAVAGLCAGPLAHAQFETQSPQQIPPGTYTFPEDRQTILVLMASIGAHIKNNAYYRCMSRTANGEVFNSCPQSISGIELRDNNTVVATDGVKKIDTSRPTRIFVEYNSQVEAIGHISFLEILSDDTGTNVRCVIYTRKDLASQKISGPIATPSVENGDVTLTTLYAPTTDPNGCDSALQAL